MGGKGSGGHNVKSTDLKILEGNRGHRKLPETSEGTTQQNQSVKIPTCPGWLNAEAKSEWRRVCQKLADMGILQTTDRSMLAGYCSAYSRWRTAEEVLNEDGLTQSARHGREARPEVKIARESLQQMRSLAVELGLTPKARTSVIPRGTAKDAGPQDPLDKALGTKRMN